MPPGSSRLLPKIGLAIGSTLLALLVAEGLTRLVGFRPEWGNLLPLHETPTRTVGGVTLWEDRDPRHDEKDLQRIAADPDAFTILGLGDSIMYGAWMAKEQTYLELARERIGGRSNRRVEVLNLAVSGYNTRQEDAVYEEIAERIRPDLVLLHYWTNDSRQYRVVGGYVIDFGDLSEDGRLVVRPLPLPPRLSDFLLVHSRFYGVLTHAAVVRKRATQVDEWTNVSEPLARIHDRARAAGARLVVLASPDLSGEMPQSTSDLPLLRQFAASRGIDVIALADWLGDVRSKEIALDGCHFNAAGHRIIGERLGEYLLERGFSPG